MCCAASIAELAFWYPEAVANRNASPDDRFGLVLMMGIPFDIVGSIIASRAIFGLVVCARQKPTTTVNLLLFVGILLALMSLSPLLIIGSRLAR